MDAAIPIPRSDRTAAAVAWLAIGVALVFSTLVGLLRPVIADPISGLLGRPKLAGDWWLLTAGVFVVAVDGVLLAWMVREGRYAALAVRNVLQGVGQASGQAGFAWTSAHLVGLVGGWIIGRLFAVGGLYWRRGLIRQAIP